MTDRSLVAVGPGLFEPQPTPDIGQVAVGETGEASVRIAHEGRPDRATRIRLGPFEGPLGLLLALIEQRELDIRTVALGDLAGAYLEALATLPGDRIPHLSGFVGTAAQLILIKSRAMLPEPPAVEDGLGDIEAPDPAEELRRRLVEYRLYRDAARLLEARLESGALIIRREPRVAVAAARAGASEPDLDPLSASLLVEALDGLARIAMPPAPPAETLRRSVTIAERVAVIREALTRAPLVVLQDLVAGVRDRVVVAVTFLALLELSKRREIMVEQAVPWGPIVCRRLDAVSRS
jgi:segregation and condensation protein A